VTGLHLDIASGLSYLVAVLVPALDALIPVLPSETVVIALGVATAGSADPRIGLLLALAAFGAFLGDNAVYLLGRRFGPAVERRLFAGERGAARRAWARRALDRFGARIIVACRFIPGGRTAVTLTCGVVGYPRRRFLAATACAGAVWASYAFFLGRLGGKVFADRPWIGLLLALGLALAVSLLIEAARRAWRSLRRRPSPATGGSRAGPPAGQAQVRRPGQPGHRHQASAHPEPATAAPEPGRHLAIPAPPSQRRTARAGR
jgi:membrane protein DedA with SNARE-associated domain